MAQMHRGFGIAKVLLRDLYRLHFLLSYPAELDSEVRLQSVYSQVRTNCNTMYEYPLH